MQIKTKKVFERPFDVLCTTLISLEANLHRIVSFAEVEKTEDFCFWVTL